MRRWLCASCICRVISSRMYGSTRSFVKSTKVIFRCLFWGIPHPTDGSWVKLWRKVQGSSISISLTVRGISSSKVGSFSMSYVRSCWIGRCNDPTIGSYNHYHLSRNGIPRGNQRWYGLVYFIQIAGKPRTRPRCNNPTRVRLFMQQVTNYLRGCIRISL